MLVPCCSGGYVCEEELFYDEIPSFSGLVSLALILQVCLFLLSS